MPSKTSESWLQQLSDHFYLHVVYLGQVFGLTWKKIHTNWGQKGRSQFWSGSQYVHWIAWGKCTHECPWFSLFPGKSPTNQPKHATVLLVYLGNNFTENTATRWCSSIYSDGWTGYIKDSALYDQYSERKVSKQKSDRFLSTVSLMVNIWDRESRQKLHSLYNFQYPTILR